MKKHNVMEGPKQPSTTILCKVVLIKTVSWLPFTWYFSSKILRRLNYRDQISYRVLIYKRRRTRSLIAPGHVNGKYTKLCTVTYQVVYCPFSILVRNLYLHLLPLSLFLSLPHSPWAHVPLLSFIVTSVHFLYLHYSLCLFNVQLEISYNYYC